MADDIEVTDESFDDEAARQDPRAKLERLKERLAHCEKEKNEYLDGWQRAKADLMNSRKDEGRRMSLWRERLEDAMILEFLPVLDNFELALSEAHENHLTPEAKRGFDLIRLQFVDTLRRFGISEIKTEDTAFDPARHEALEEVESGKPPGSIAEVLQRGYERNGIVLRPARVKVSKIKSD